LEVIDTICEIENISKTELLKVQEEKRETRGGFAGGIIMNKKV
jgi:predicted house-cleaning noncanonical NTP pyrophosphatase (MazG superfamily)